MELIHGTFNRLEWSGYPRCLKKLQNSVLATDELSDYDQAHCIGSSTPHFVLRAVPYNCILHPPSSTISLQRTKAESLWTNSASVENEITINFLSWSDVVNEFAWVTTIAVATAFGLESLRLPKWHFWARFRLISHEICAVRNFEVLTA